MNIIIAHRPYILAYLIAVFILGATRHLVLFKKLYDSFGNFDALHKPRFEFGILSMILQGFAFGLLYQQVVHNHITQQEFILIVFLLLISFIAFAELGKHHVTRVGLFIVVQLLYCVIQTAITAAIFYWIS